MKKILIVTAEHVKEGLLIVKRLSYSAMRQFLTSENLFIKKYVRLEFDEQGKPAMMVWNAGHKALELYQQDKIDGNEPRDYFKIAQDEFQRIIQEKRDLFQKKLFPGKVKRPDNEEEVKVLLEKLQESDFLTVEEIEQIEKEAIQWSKQVTPESCIEALNTSLKNYFETGIYKNAKTISTEISETVTFTNLEGEIMPVPLKGIIDRVVSIPELGEGMTDYKFVWKLSDTSKPEPSYEIQAGVLYFIYYGLKGKAPDFIIFEEILKSEWKLELAEDPSRKLLQADLRELCDKYGLGWEKFEKNVDLESKLLLAGVLRKGKTVQNIVYEYAKRKDILEVTLEIYRRIVNRLGFMSLFDVPYDSLLNPFEKMFDAWLEAYKDLQEEVSLWRDPLLTEKKVEGDFDEEDDFEF